MGTLTPLEGTSPSYRPPKYRAQRRGGLSFRHYGLITTERLTRTLLLKRKGLRNSYLIYKGPSTELMVIHVRCINFVKRIKGTLRKELSVGSKKTGCVFLTQPQKSEKNNPSRTKL